MVETVVMASLDEFRGENCGMETSNKLHLFLLPKCQEESIGPSL